MTDTDTIRDPVRSLAQKAAFGRMALVKGTPEKYPGTEVRVNLLDLEAAIAEVRELRRILYAAVDAEAGFQTAQDVQAFITNELAAEPSGNAREEEVDGTPPGAASIATTPKEVVEPGGVCPSEATVSTEPLSGRPPGSATSFGADDWATVEAGLYGFNYRVHQAFKRLRAADQAKTEALREIANDTPTQHPNEALNPSAAWKRCRRVAASALAAAAAAPKETL